MVSINIYTSESEMQQIRVAVNEADVVFLANEKLVLINNLLHASIGQ